MDGAIAEAPEENWQAIDLALRVGVRGLPGGSSLSRLPWTAVVSWGDGQTSTYSLSPTGDLYEPQEAPADHVYQYVGLYGVQTLFYDLAGELVGMTASMVMADPAPPKALPSWNGPQDVPGNSDYWYWVDVSPFPKKRLPPGFDPLGTKQWTVSDPVATVTHGNYAGYMGTNGLEYVTAFGAEVEFKNKPAQLTLTLAPWAFWITKPFTIRDINVVQVKVRTPENAFAASQTIKDRMEADLGPGSTDVVIDGKSQKAETQQLTSWSKDRKTPGMTWQAEVTLVPPDTAPEAVQHIKVGFHQTDEVKSQHSTFGKTVMKSSMEGQTYLDVADGYESDRPWYVLVPKTNAHPASYMTGETGPVTIGARDGPGAIFITNYGPNQNVADSDDWLQDFHLSVAAATLDGGSLDPDYSPSYKYRLFQEASAEWLFDADGFILVGGRLANGLILTSWTPKGSAAVKPISDTWATDMASPKLLLTKGDLANEAAKKQTFTTK